MTKQPIKLEGYAYRQGDAVEVYLRLEGKYVKLSGDARQAQRNFGRLTREPHRGRYSDGKPG